MYNPDMRIDCFTQQGTIDLANPKPQYIYWPSLAECLSRIARYNGATGHIGTYSVAQHCVIGADALFSETGNPFIAGCFLLHDAHEAFIGDITTPVADYFACQLGVDFKSSLTGLKNIWTKTILTAAGINLDEAFAVQDAIDDMDHRMLAIECKVFFPEQAQRFQGVKPVHMKSAIKYTGSVRDELAFLDRLSRYLDIRERQ